MLEEEQDRDDRGTQTFIRKVLDQMTAGAVGALPNSPGVNPLKAWLMRLRGARIGRGVKFWSGIWIDRFDRLQIGEDATIGKSVLLVCGGGVHLGRRTMIGHGSKLISAKHRIPPNRAPMRFAGTIFGKVTIKDDAWLAAQSLVLPGVTVGEGAVVGAGSVVTHDVPPYAVVAGVPARIMRMRE